MTVNKFEEDYQLIDELLQKIAGTPASKVTSENLKEAISKLKKLRKDLASLDPSILAGKYKYYEDMITAQIDSLKKIQGVKDMSAGV
jgi:hypothetical protein